MATLKATKRDKIGTSQARRLREGGRIPGIVYGHGEQPVPVTLDRHEIELAVLHRERLLEIDVDGRTESVLIKDVQYDSLGTDLLHVDLARVDLDESVEVTVPVLLRGTPAGAADGGVLHQLVSQVTIECTAKQIPENLRVQVNEMKLDDVLYLRDIPLPEGARLLEEPDALLCSVSLVTEKEAAPAEEAAAEPEVIGEKKEEGEEEAEEREG